MQQNPNQQQLETFAVAAVEVQRINNDYQPRFAAANSFEEQCEIQKEATDMMAQAVEDKGMTVDQFNDVARAAQSDPQVAKQVSDLVMKAIE